jgi:thymidine phosphorylase
MQTIDGARDLARTMVGIGIANEVETIALITAMDQPLGRAVGNANEIEESVAVLRGEGPADVTELTMAFGEVMMELGGVDGGRDRLERAITSGAALEKLIDVTRAHGGDPSVLEDTSRLDVAPEQATIDAPADGIVTRCDALSIGLAATRLGAGRERKEDTVDHGVGITVHAKIGERVSVGDALATVRFRDEARWEAQRERLATAWEIGDDGPAPGPLIMERIGRSEI